MGRSSTTLKKNDERTVEIASKGGKVPSVHLRSFKTPQELRDAVDEYVTKTKKEDMTITGLMLDLGITWHTMNAYNKGEVGEGEEAKEFQEAMQLARLYVENAYEQDLRGGKPVGSIFALKNLNKEEWNENSEKTQNINLNLGVVELPRREYIDGGSVEGDFRIIDDKKVQKTKDTVEAPGETSESTDTD